MKEVMDLTGVRFLEGSRSVIEEIVECRICHAVVASTRLSRHESWHREQDSHLQMLKSEADRTHRRLDVGIQRVAVEASRATETRR